MFTKMPFPTPWRIHMYGIYTLKSTIREGKYTIVPWILWVPFLNFEINGMIHEINRIPMDPLISNPIYSQI